MTSGSYKNKKINVVPYNFHDKSKYYDPAFQHRSLSVIVPPPQQQRTPVGLLSMPSAPPPASKIKCRINIEAEVDDLADLINIGKKVGTEFKLEPHIEYNIDLAMIRDLLPEMEDMNNMIGQQEFKRQVVILILYYSMRLNRKNDDLLHTAIYGEPGTGKTEFAQKLAKIYLKMGVLKNGIFKKVRRGDLIAGYLGQTSLKTAEVLKSVRGGVLFIDEAYALGNNEKKDSFSKECIDTLCEALSDNKNNLMVIIAGYETELKECFFNYNQGLDSRFTWRFSTDEYKADELFKIFLKKVRDIEWIIADDSNIKIEWFKKNMDYFKFFGRDMETLLAKTKIAHSKRVFCKQENEKKKRQK